MGLLNIYLVTGAKVRVTLRDNQKSSQSQNSRWYILTSNTIKKEHNCKKVDNYSSACIRMAAQ